MLEDDLRYFPMDTTNYIQRLRASEHYQDILGAQGLFKTISHSVESRVAEGSFCSETIIQADWLNHGLSFTIHHLQDPSWDRSLVDWMARHYAVMTLRPVDTTDALLHSRDNRDLIRLVKCLRCKPDIGNPTYVSMRG
jgi:hypothetical protein